MKKQTIFILSLMLIISPLISAEDAKPKTPTFKDFISMEWPSSPLISPDGTMILFTVRSADWENNEYKTQIWRADLKTGKIRQMTFSQNSSSSPQWSPDGQSISFISARDKKAQIYIMSISGGEAYKLTDSPTGISAYKWSPDGLWIVYTAVDEESKAKKERKEKFGRFEIVDQEYDVNHLWFIDVKTKESKKLVEREDLNISSFSWSPDTKAIAFSAFPGPRVTSYVKADIYIINLEDRSIRHLVDLKGPDTTPLWSPDGKFIAFSSKMGSEEFFINSRICIVPAQGGSITSLTGHFDESPSPIAWKKDGIYFQAQQKMSSHLFKIHPDSKKIEQITQGDGFFLRGVSLTEDGSQMAFIFVDAHHAPEIYTSQLPGFSPEEVTDYSRQIAGWTLSIKEPIKWNSTDGTPITGVLIKPADFNPEKKYPLMVIIHGGPMSISYPQLVDRYNIYYPIEQWAAKGAVILEPNYRGSTGFGEEFRKLNYRNLGIGDYWDVISGVDHLIGQGFIDPGRLGAMGWSQGGYISAFITTYSDQFKAVSVGAGISDWITYYVNTDIHHFTRHYLGATPWDDEEIYRKTSPMTYINNAQTPTLIQHGEFDKRVPIPNAFKLYQGLQDKGVPVKFIIYKGFGHGISKPKENLAVLTHNDQWFKRYIWNEAGDK